MLLRKIEELRKQPKPVRDRYALTLSIVVTSFIAVIWLVSLPARFGEAPSLVAEIDDESGGFSRALSDVKGQMGNVFGGLGESLEEMQAVVDTVEDTGSDTANSESAEDLYQIDINAMFPTENQGLATNSAETLATTSFNAQATSSAEARSKTERGEAKKVLIGTTSASN